MKKILCSILALAMVLSLCLLAACSDEGNDNSGEEAKETIKYVNIKLTDEQYAYAVAKDNAELLTAANSVLAEIKANGELDKIVKKYFSADTANIKLFDAGEVDESKKQLVVATNTPFAPFEYKEGNKFCGIDIEIASLIAEKIGAELVIKDMDFDAVLTAVEQGSADIAMAGLTYSEDRAKTVNFSDTYYNASQVVICKIDDTPFDACKTAEDVEAILKSFDSKKIIGYQNGTTGGLYVLGDDDWGFEGFPVTGKGYESAVNAVMAMVNGQIDYVVVDEGPATIIVKSVNGK